MTNQTEAVLCSLAIPWSDKIIKDTKTNVNDLTHLSFMYDAAISSCGAMYVPKHLVAQYSLLMAKATKETFH